LYFHNMCYTCNQIETPMKKQIAKIAMDAVVAMAFVASLTLSVEKNETGGWSLEPIAVFGQSGEEGNQCSSCVKNKELTAPTCLVWVVEYKNGQWGGSMQTGSKRKCKTSDGSQCDTDKVKGCEAN